MNQDVLIAQLKYTSKNADLFCMTSSGFSVLMSALGTVAPGNNLKVRAIKQSIHFFRLRRRRYSLKQRNVRRNILYGTRPSGILDLIFSWRLKPGVIMNFGNFSKKLKRKVINQSEK